MKDLRAFALTNLAQSPLKQVLLVLLLLITACMPENDPAALPTLVEFPPTLTLNPSEEAALNASQVAVSQNSTPSPLNPSQEANLQTEVWLTLEGAKAYACAAFDCDVLQELEVGWQFNPLETSEEWHRILLEDNQTAFIPISFSQLQITLSDENLVVSNGEGETANTNSLNPNENASNTNSNTNNSNANSGTNAPAAQASPTGQQATAASGYVPSTSIPNNSGVVIQPGQSYPSGGQNNGAISTVQVPTAIVINTLIPTQRPVINQTNIPPTATGASAVTSTATTSAGLPIIASLTPTQTQEPPPIINVPPQGN